MDERRPNAELSNGSRTQGVVKKKKRCSRTVPYGITARPHQRRASLDLTPASLRSQSSANLKTRFLVISDTHDLELSTMQVPKVDVVLHCGDLTENGGLTNYERIIRSLGAIEAELKLVIPGNHDLELDRNFYVKEGGEVEICDTAIGLWSGELARSMGIFYLHEGVHTFTLTTGAKFTIFASPFTPQYGTSAFQYPSGEDRFNYPHQTPAWAVNTGTGESVIPDFPAIDIVMTHGPPKYILDNCVDRSSGGCEHLRRAICRARPRLHCFGHIHHAWGASKVGWKEMEETNSKGTSTDPDGDENLIPLALEVVAGNSWRARGYAALTPESSAALMHGTETLLVNAAIINDAGQPGNAPWIVELDLTSQL